MSNIEDGFEPDTVNEAVLLMRIRELKLAAYKANSYDMNPYSRLDDPMLIDRINPTLVLAAELKAGWESDSRYHVVATARRGSGRGIHYGHYISREIFEQCTAQAAAQALGNLHKRAIGELTALVMSEKVP